MGRRTSRSRLLGVVLVLGLAATVSACGERDDEPGAGSSETSSSSPTETAGADPALPACGDVWVAGKPFPDEYAGCNDGDEAVVVEPIVCETGQMVYRHDDRFYATNGAPVREAEGSLQEDPQYQSMYEACTA